MIKIAICDDSDYMRNETKKHVLRYSMQRNMDIDIEEYSKGEDLLKDNESFDIIFMDYQFENGGADGITISKEIREKDKDVAIMFLSSFPGVVFESFEVGTFRFLVKPLDPDKFDSAMDAFIQSMETDNVLTIKVDGDNCFIKESRILYIEGFGKYCIIHMAGEDEEEIECHETLASVEERLTSTSFFRCHKSYVVNMSHIEAYNKTTIELEFDQTVQISRNKYKDFSDAFTNYIKKHNLGR